MKKSVKIVVASLLACAMAMACTACSLFTKRGASDSNFPYDVAVQNGYQGTEGKWASEQQSPSTLYRRMYEEAVADGYTGSYFEFLKELNLTAADATPYIQRALLSVVSIVCTFRGLSEGSAGSGVIIELDKEAGDAYILTNYHVIYESGSFIPHSTDIHVYLYGNETAQGDIPARYIGGIMNSDIAVLKVEDSAVLRESYALAAPVADSSGVMVGQPIYAIGNAMNENITATSGIVSMELEYIYMNALDGDGYMNLPAIRIDAAVNHGNSGGGLFNALGELVGIVNGRDERDGVEGFYYAIPSNIAMAIAENVIENNGAYVADLAFDLTIDSTKAVYDETLGRTHFIEKLVVDYRYGAAAAAGVLTGDTVVSATIVRGGEEVISKQFLRLPDVLTFQYKVRFGDTVKLTVSREGTGKVLTYNFNQQSFFKHFA